MTYNNPHPANASWSDPAEGAFAITASNTQNLPRDVRGIHVGTGGNLVAKMVTGDVVFFKNLMSGMYYPYRIRAVLSSSDGNTTTATDIVGLV